MVRQFFVLGDGDQIRARVEGYLLGGDMGGLSRYSRSLREAIVAAAATAEATLAAKVHVAAGDDLLLEVEAPRYERARIEEIGNQFFDASGSTISFGVGPTPESAYLALRKAKARGGATVVERDLKRA